MVSSNKKEFIAIIIQMAEGLQCELSKVQIEFYYKILSDMKFEDFNRAANILAREHKGYKFPQPADFRDIVMPSLSDASILALEKIEKNIGDPYPSVVFDDPIIHAVIDAMGGWLALNEAYEDIEDWKWTRKEILKLYQVMAKNFDGRKVSLKLQGLHERNNKGLYDNHIPQPKLIGDKKLIEEWTGKHKEITEGNKVKELVENIAIMEGEK